MIIQSTEGLQLIVELFSQRLKIIETHLEWMPDRADLLRQQKVLKEHIMAAKSELLRNEILKY